MNRPKVSRPSSSSRSATPLRASRRKVLPSFWSSRISGSPRPSRTSITSSSRAGSSMPSRTRSYKPIWTNCTPISASEQPERFTEETVMKTRIAASLLLGTALSFAPPSVPLAQDKIVKIGALSDQSGLYADLGGPGSTLAAQMAVEDSGLTAKGWKIDVISGDHQNKPDVGVNIARQWFDVEKVDVIVDVPNSGVALAVSNLVKGKNGIVLDSGAGSSDLTNAQCTPNTIHWTYDTYTLAHGTGSALAKSGGDSWFFLTADYAFGAALERDTTSAVQAAGGKVLGGVKHPLGTSDFSSFLLQAQASKAKVIGLANAGSDTTNAIKQAAEFGIVAGGQKLAALLLFITDVHSLGLATAQGLNFTETFYWDMNDQTRAWSKKFSAQSKTGSMPS